MPLSSEIDSLALHQIRVAAKRLEHCSLQVKQKVWTGDFVGSLADAAEVGEIARRLYLKLQQFIEAKNGP